MCCCRAEIHTERFLLGIMLRCFDLNNSTSDSWGSHVLALSSKGYFKLSVLHAELVVFFLEAGHFRVGLDVLWVFIWSITWHLDNTWSTTEINTTLLQSFVCHLL